MLTQGALLWNALNSIAAHAMTSEDHILTVLPMFHVGGLNIQTTPAILAGATITLARRFDPGETLDLLETRRPTLFLAVPAVAQALSRHPRFAAADLSSLRAMCTGSSTVPEAVIRPWMDRGIPVTQVYGMTESGPTAIALSIADAARKVGSCGKPAAHSEARIVDAEGRDVAQGQPGEIWLRGPNLMTGYWRNPEATADAFTDGWLRTGDIGHQDADGFYYIDDRKKDVVISGGENIYPAELEAILADCPRHRRSRRHRPPRPDLGRSPHRLHRPPPRRHPHPRRRPRPLPRPPGPLQAPPRRHLPHHAAPYRDGQSRKVHPPPPHHPVTVRAALRVHRSRCAAAPHDSHRLRRL